ncbi:MAG: hypothetical protein JWR26_3792 [Pedosphaera sp.]|nr:hypothetical protein [Pedosphaera sp.]
MFLASVKGRFDVDIIIDLIRVPHVQKFLVSSRTLDLPQPEGMGKKNFTKMNNSN